MNDAYAEYEVIEPVWGEDTDVVEQWFAEGEDLGHGDTDWIYWIDLYKDGAERSDLLVHWLRCLFDPALPRPPQLGAT